MSTWKQVKNIGFPTIRLDGEDVSDLTQYVILFFQELGLHAQITSSLTQTIKITGSRDNNYLLEIDVYDSASGWVDDPTCMIYYLNDNDPGAGPYGWAEISMADPSSLKELKEWASKIQ